MRVTRLLPKVQSTHRGVCSWRVPFAVVSGPLRAHAVSAAIVPLPGPIASHIAALVCFGGKVQKPKTIIKKRTENRIYFLKSLDSTLYQNPLNDALVIKVNV